MESKEEVNGWNVKEKKQETNEVGGRCLCPLLFNTPCQKGQKRKEKKYGKNVKSQHKPLNCRKSVACLS